MAINIAINGFGRIGRALARLIFKSSDLNLVAINDLCDINQILYLLNYDSTHGVLENRAEIIDSKIVYKNHKISVYSEIDNKKIPFKNDNIDVLLECTGKFLDQKSNLCHIENGIKKVIISAIPSDNTNCYLIGINDTNIKNDVIISAGSCTSNAIAVLILALQNDYKIKDGFVTSIHSYNSDQHLLDVKGSANDLRKLRSATTNIIPVSSGSGKNISKILSNQNSLDFKGIGIRVPTECVCILDVTILFENSVQKDELNMVVKRSCDTFLKDLLSFSDQKIVSRDILGCEKSGVIDSDLTMSIKNLGKFVIWHDNEYGFAARIIEICRKVI